MRQAIFLVLCAACAHEQVKQAVAPVAGQRKRAPRLLDVPAGVVHKEALELMAKGDWEGAADKLEDFLEREPKNAAGLFESGWVAERQLDLAAAEGFYQRALAVDPGHAGAALNLARLWREKPAEAERVLRAALAKQEDEPRLLAGLAAALRAQRKLDEAGTLARKVLERHPKDVGAIKTLASVEADQGHPRLAEALLQNARKLDDKDAGILNALGLLALGHGEATAARGWFEEATRLDPTLAAAWANLGALALRYRDYGAAADAYGKAVALEGEEWQTHLGHGWALEGLRQHRAARGEYEKVLALRPVQEDALYGKAAALKAENDLPAALEAFKAYLASGKPARSKEAEGQIASIALRLKNPPPQRPAPQRDKPAAAGQPDLTRLPEGGDASAPAEKLPELDGPGDGLKSEPQKPPAPAAKPGAQAAVVQ